MKFVLIFTLWTGGPAVSPAQPARDAWFGRDKALHFAVAAAIQGGAHAAFRARGAPYERASWGAAGVTVAASVGKEWWDRRRTRVFSLRDLAWDGAGGATAAVVVRQVDR